MFKRFALIALISVTSALPGSAFALALKKDPILQSSELLFKKQVCRCSCTTSSGDLLWSEDDENTSESDCPADNGDICENDSGSQYGNLFCRYVWIAD